MKSKDAHHTPLIISGRFDPFHVTLVLARNNTGLAISQADLTARDPSAIGFTIEQKSFKDSALWKKLSL